MRLLRGEFENGHARSDSEAAEVVHARVAHDPRSARPRPPQRRARAGRAGPGAPSASVVRTRTRGSHAGVDEVPHRRVGEQPAPAEDDEVVGERGGLVHQVAGDQDGAALAGERRISSRIQMMPSGSSPFDGSSSRTTSRVAEQRGGDAEPLAHSEGERPDPAAGDRGEARLLQHLVRRVRPGGGCSRRGRSRWSRAVREPWAAWASSRAPTWRSGLVERRRTPGRRGWRCRRWAGPGRGRAAWWWTCRRRWGRGSR